MTRGGVGASWLRFAPARWGCGGLLRGVAPGCAGRGRVHRGDAEGAEKRGRGDCRFGGWVRFAVFATWREVEDFGTSGKAPGRACARLALGFVLQFLSWLHLVAWGCS